MSTVAAISGKRPLDILRTMGYRTVLLDSQIPFDLALDVDVPLEVDLQDWASVETALRAVHRRTPLTAVLGTKETHLALAGYLADRLGCRGLALHAALNCFDKLRTRQVLASAHIAGPRYAAALDRDEAITAAEALRFPVIVKPHDGTGGEGVTLCLDAHAVGVAADELLKRQNSDSRPHHLLLEEYIDGPEFSVLAITASGQTEVVNILAPTFSPPPRFVVLDCRCPAALSATEQASLTALITRMLTALGVDNAVTHTQVRWTVDGPKVIEVNTRPPGGQMVRLTEAVCGIDLVRAAVEVTVGQPISRTAPVAGRALYRSIVFPHAGTLHYREEIETAGVPDLECPIPPVIELDVHPGEVVLPTSHGGVYGRIAVFGHDDAQLERDYRRVLAALELRLMPLANSDAGMIGTKAVKKCC